MRGRGCCGRRPPGRQVREAAALAGHPSLAELLAAGADLVVGSGDKLLGGPQAGLLLGRRDLVAACARHPIYRAVRPGRLVTAALDGVLRLHLAGRPLPIDRLWESPENLEPRLAPLAARLGAEILQAPAFVGGGAAPEIPISGPALALPGPSRRRRSPSASGGAATGAAGPRRPARRPLLARSADGRPGRRRDPGARRRARARGGEVAAAMALRLLVVEDRESLRRMLVRALGGEGYAVAAAGDLAEARALLAGEPIDLVLTDLMLPDGSGLDVLALARRRRTPPPPVLVLTGFGSVAAAVAAMKLGAADFLEKPVDIDRLFALVAGLVEEPAAPPVFGPPVRRRSSARIRCCAPRSAPSSASRRPRARCC